MSNEILKATHDGELIIGEVTIPCAVLNDGTRLITQRGMHGALGRSGSTGGLNYKDDTHKLPRFLAPNNLKPFISEELACSAVPILFKKKSGGKTAYGFKAEILPMVCTVYLQARDAGQLQPNQLKFANHSDLLIRSLAHVGIIALVDEATGYQDSRVKNALEEILNKFLLEHQKPYIGTFPIEFYKILFKLNNWPWNPSSTKRPGVIGRWTNDIIYERLAPGVLEELQRRNPTYKPGRRKHKNFQFLTHEYGDPALRAHFGAVIALGRVAPNMRKFWNLLNRALPKYGDQLMLDFDDLD